MYGTYTVMDTETNKSLDFTVVHVGTVAYSYAMEKQGLINCLNSLKTEGINVVTLAIDGHLQIKAFMKSQKTDINHQFDIWHVSRNIHSGSDPLGFLIHSGF